jgi:hypothetical protein
LQSLSSSKSYYFFGFFDGEASLRSAFAGA